MIYLYLFKNIYKPNSVKTPYSMIRLILFSGFKDGSIYTNQNHNTGLRRFQDGG
jgi:hypothetical protein